MSEKLTAMITPLVRKALPEKRIWDVRSESMSSTFSKRRKAIAEKLGNPKLRKITFKTFRHWKATTKYHKTKDILYVKELLGHKNIKNTLIYTHLVEFEENDQFVVKVAKTLDEFTEFLELGFNYVSDYEGMKVLRKRK